jgi:hypothetical protein
MGQSVGQERHYCGTNTPPDFFSYGPEAQIITSLDSSSDTMHPYFEATYKAELCDRKSFAITIRIK